MSGVTYVLEAKELVGSVVPYGASILEHLLQGCQLRDDLVLLLAWRHIVGGIGSDLARRRQVTVNNGSTSQDGQLLQDSPRRASTC